MDTNESIHMNEYEMDEYKWIKMNEYKWINTSEWIQMNEY